MNETILEVNDLKLKYKITKTSTLKRELLRIGKNSRDNVDKFAIDGVSFSVNHGDVVGIIGKNGAGKSTLLRVIANIYKPDSGNINNMATSTSLLSIGTGFVNDLTGIENTYLSGLLQGLSKTQIDERLEDIIEFSGIGNSVYQPIRTYSTGMRARLAFSISSHIDPEMLLIDELLGVGDKDFKEKSSNKIKEMIRSDKTVLLVSHSLGTIKTICNKVLWLDMGKVVMYGSPEEVISKYNKA